MEKSNYNLVKEIIKNYEEEGILNDFLNNFKEGKNISEEDYFNFCLKYSGDCGDWYYINLNWEYIKSGDVNVYNNI